MVCLDFFFFQKKKLQIIFLLCPRKKDKNFKVRRDSHQQNSYNYAYIFLESRITAKPLHFKIINFNKNSWENIITAYASTFPFKKNLF